MSTPEPPRNFLRDIIDADLAAGRHTKVVTRFPPEPNGYLHIGHAKSLTINFGLARDYAGVCHLRMDDTNPLAEDTEFVASIQEDIRWLGFDWGDHFFHAADYFEQLYAYARELIDRGLAYVCSQTEEEVREYRGTVSEPGRPSPDRDRPAAESLELLDRMRAGDFEDEAYTLRARIDMAAANMKLRDPPIYRIRHATHHRTGDAWCIYPMYDFAHGLSDSIEGITHSICTLEFENNRALYDWFIENTSTPRPRPHQYEFARLALTYTVMSKRKLKQLVTDGLVSGWDDPRMPTLSGMRRRGYPPAAIRAFCERIGVAKANSLVDVRLLEHAVRDELNRTAPRAMAVLRPLKLTITNRSADAGETVELPNHPDRPELGTREVSFGPTLWIERDDFAADPPPKFRRLAPGREVRLRGAYFVTCTGVVKDDDGEVVEVLCTHDPATRGGSAPDGRRVKGTIHWLDAATARPVEARLYDRLFDREQPDQVDGDWTSALSDHSLEVLSGALVEPAAADAEAGATFQFERLGYFCVDPDRAGDRPVFNRVVALRDSKPKAAHSHRHHRDAAPSEPAASEHTAGRGASASGSEPAPSAAASTADAAPSDAPDPELETALAPLMALGISSEAAGILLATPALHSLYEAAAEAGADPKSAANLVANDLVRELKGRPPEALPFGGAQLAGVIALADAGTVSGTAARAVLAELIERGGEPAEIVDRLGLRQLSSDDALSPLVDAVLADHPDEVARYRAGEARLIGFLVGQVMRRSGGRADPRGARSLLEQRLG